MPPYEQQWNLRKGFQRTGGLISDQIDGLYAERILNPGRFVNHFDPMDKLPQANATLDQAFTVEALRLTNRSWESAGVGVADADFTFNETGGVNLVVPANDGDEVIMVEHDDAGQNILNQMDWDNDLQPLFLVNFLTGTNIATTIVWMGWKLTSVEPVITDDDQSFFRYEDAVNGGRWQAVTSVDGIDVSTDTGVTFQASTAYRMCIHLDANRISRYYINGDLVATAATARVAGDAIIPVIGVAADGASTATQITVRNTFISQLYG